MCLLYNCNRYLQCTMLQTRAAIFPARLNPILGRASLPAPFALACARGAAGASARGAVVRVLLFLSTCVDADVRECMKIRQA